MDVDVAENEDTPQHLDLQMKRKHHTAYKSLIFIMGGYRLCS